MTDETKDTAAAVTADATKTAPSGAVSDSGAADKSPTNPPAGGVGGEDAKATAASPGTLLSEGDKGKDKPVAAPADWPADWRQKLAGEDKALLKQLDRLGSPGDLFKSYRALQQKVSAGELKASIPYPETGTDQEKAAWRKENGVPEKPDDYKIETPKGFLFGDADKPLLDSFKQFAHGKNWTPSQLNQAAEWYAAEQEQMRARQDEADATFRQQAEDALRSEWGQDFRPNVNAVKNLLSTAPAGLADRLMGARLADGKLLGDDPVALKFLAGLSRELNPGATLVPAGSDVGRGIAARKAELEAMISDRRSAYYKGTNANALQNEYREILVAEDKMKSRAA